MWRFGRSMLIAIGALLVSAVPAEATFPGDNGKLALGSYHGSSRVYTTNADGSDVVRLTSGLTGNIYEDDYKPSWSPDGTRIAFASHVRETRVWKIETMAADGSDRRPILEDTVALGDPAWSPDGTRIVFTRQTALYIADVSGANAAPVPIAGTVPDVAANPDWSPDGTQIAFNGAFFRIVCDPTEPGDCERLLANPDLYVVEPSGAGIRRLTTAPESEAFPSWSPDGERIVFGSSERFVQILDPRTGAVDDLGGLNRGYSPVWSPDGRRIAFSTLFRGYDDPGAVGVMNADGTGRVEIVESGDGFSHPQHITSSWQPIPNRRPDCSTVTGDPTVLWPPNRKLRLITLTPARDPDGDATSIDITGVTQDEPVGGGRDAQPAAGDGAVRLRAKRDPRGDGRVYRIAYEAVDQRGASCEGVSKVEIPRRRALAAVDSAPPSYDSYGHQRH